jgi:hypothetical protein
MIAKDCPFAKEKASYKLQNFRDHVMPPPALASQNGRRLAKGEQ